jgi:ABC-type amino acid transport substrate-binding protein
VAVAFLFGISRALGATAVVVVAVSIALFTAAPAAAVVVVVTFADSFLPFSFVEVSLLLGIELVCWLIAELPPIEADAGTDTQDTLSSSFSGKSSARNALDEGVFGM